MQCVNKYVLRDAVFLMIKIVPQYAEMTTEIVYSYTSLMVVLYRGAGKSLARPGRKQATATEDFEFHVSYL